MELKKTVRVEKYTLDEVQVRAFQGEWSWESGD